MSEKMKLQVTLVRYGVKLNAQNGIRHNTCKINMLQCCSVVMSVSHH